MNTDSLLKPTFIEVTAPWCAECRAMKPTIEAVADRHPDVAFRVIDASSDPETATALDVKATPTLIGYANGVELFRTTGRRTSVELESLFQAAASDADPPPIGKGDMLLRVGAGAVLVVLGLVSGPVWTLVGIGAVVGLFGFLPMGKRNR